MSDLILGRAEAPSFPWLSLISFCYGGPDALFKLIESLISRIDRKREKSTVEQLAYTICVTQ